MIKAEPSAEYAGKYKPIENIAEYLKKTFPKFFEKKREEYDEQTRVARV
jgi:hypothetical protein